MLSLVVVVVVVVVVTMFLGLLESEGTMGMFGCEELCSTGPITGYKFFGVNCIEASGDRDSTRDDIRGHGV
jgi:hypothetical protein